MKVHIKAKVGPDYDNNRVLVVQPPTSFETAIWQPKVERKYLVYLLCLRCTRINSFLYGRKRLIYHTHILNEEIIEHME